MIEKMIDRFNSLSPVPEALAGQLQLITKIETYPKKHILLKEGQVANHACFVFKGLARAYYITDGKDITSRFMDEGFIITSWISFYTRKPGYEFVEMLEESTVGCVHHDDLQKLYNDFPEFNIIGRKLTEYYFFLSEQRTHMLRKKTAEEKYEFFLKQHPDLMQRAPLKHIATYLGMNEETFSRTRSKFHRQ